MKKPFLLTLVLFLAIGAQAQDVFNSELYSSDLVLRNRSEIGLSDKQVEKVKSIYNKKIAEFNSLKWDLDAEMESLKKTLQETHVNSKAALERMKIVSALEEKLKLMKLETLIDIKNELTESQQNKLTTLKEDKGSFNIKPISENPRIVIRGAKGKNAAKPLYYVIDKNGERRVNDIENIKPDNIESMNVFKGESAIKTYGKAGENGVIVIKMKDK
ncbi:MAG: hypothetical protein ACI9IP_000324 [Arcticibacterium sp.]|jgi:hypothetical protein